MFLSGWVLKRTNDTECICYVRARTREINKCDDSNPGVRLSWPTSESLEWFLQQTFASGIDLLGSCFVWRSIICTVLGHCITHKINLAMPEYLRSIWHNEIMGEFRKYPIGIFDYPMRIGVRYGCDHLLEVYVLHGNPPFYHQCVCIYPTRHSISTFHTTSVFRKLSLSNTVENAPNISPETLYCTSYTPFWSNTNLSILVNMDILLWPCVLDIGIREFSSHIAEPYTYTRLLVHMSPTNLPENMNEKIKRN